MEVKALAQEQEKERKLATKGLKGKEKKRAITSLKDRFRQQEIDLQAVHEKELGKDTNEAQTMAEATFVVLSKSQQAKEEVDLSDIPVLVQQTAQYDTRTETLTAEDGWEKISSTLSNSQKKNYGRAAAKARRAAAAATHGGRGGRMMESVISSVYIDALRSVGRLRVLQVCGLVRKFRSKHVVIVGAKEGGRLVEGVRDACPLVQRLAVLGRDRDELLVSIGRVQTGAFGRHAQDMIRPRQRALDVTAWRGDLVEDVGSLPGVLEDVVKDTIVFPEWIQCNNMTHGVQQMLESLFCRLQPKCVIFTTVNKAFNPIYNMHEDQVRSAEHLWEMTHHEFRKWSQELAEKWGYDVQVGGVGDPPSTVDSTSVGQSSSWCALTLNEKKAGTKQRFFRFAVAMKKVISDWPLLKFALAQSTGGAETPEKIDRIYEDLEFNFLERWERTVKNEEGSEIFPDEIFVYLDEVMSDDLNIDAEDGSCDDISIFLVDMFKLAVKGDFSKVDSVVHAKPLAPPKIVIEESPPLEFEELDTDVSEEDDQIDEEHDMLEGSDEKASSSGCVNVTAETKWSAFWCGCLHDMLAPPSQAGSGSASTSRAADKSGNREKSKHFKQMQQVEKVNAKQSRTKSSFLNKS